MTFDCVNMADPRGPRLFVDLNYVFKRDPNIDEYDIVPVLEPKHNRSPFFLQEHKLGVEAWAVKLLMKYAVNRLIGWRSQKPTEKFIDYIEVSHLTRAVLLFNPDNYTAWNIRKELVESGHLTLTEDLAFGVLILTKHPKSPETFIHRRWLFQQLLDHCLSSSSGSNASCSGVECCVNMDSIDIDISAPLESAPTFNIDLSLESSRLLKTHSQSELEVTSHAAEKYPCNYHAWSHRMWIIQHCLNCSLQVLLSELKSTELWTSKHISDHSGFHYRQFLLKELHARKGILLSSFSVNSTELFMSEMAFVCDLIQSYPGHEALWYHRRFLFQAMLSAEHLNIKINLQLPASNGHIHSSGQVDSTNFKSLVIAQEIDSVKTQERSSMQTYNQVLVKKYIQWVQTLI